MAAVWTTHPRYSLLLVFVLLGTLYMLLPDNSPPPPVTVYPVAVSTRDRVARANRIYDTFIQQRKGLIKKFGPTPDSIMMFPPDVRPWPAYTVWDFFQPAYNCPHEVERVGALGDGGKWLCGLSRLAMKQDCVIYSFGINHESSFEAEILRSSQHCQVWGYDYSVDSFGPEITPDLSFRTNFYPYSLGGWDGSGPDNSKLFTLETLMKKNNHQHIDVLKIDIEGWEFEALEAILKPYLSSGKPLPFGQLQLEVHVWSKTFPQFLKFWQMLEDAGLRPFMTEPNMVYQNYNRYAHSDLAEYSFININGDNVFITD